MLIIGPNGSRASYAVSASSAQKLWLSIVTIRITAATSTSPQTIQTSTGTDRNRIPARVGDSRNASGPRAGYSEVVI